MVIGIDQVQHGFCKEFGKYPVNFTLR